MSLKDDKQQNTQIELDFSSALTGEAREAGREGLSRPGRRLEPKTQPAFRPYSRNASVTVSNRRVRTRTHGGVAGGGGGGPPPLRAPPPGGGVMGAGVSVGSGGG